MVITQMELTLQLCCYEANEHTTILYNNILAFRLLNPKSDQLQARTAQNMEDSLIKSVQSSTRALINTFRDKTKLLSNCSDIKFLLREGYDQRIAKVAAQKFFGNSKVPFVAIDGTESQDEHLGMLIFYTGAFGYVGELEFLERGCSCGEVVEAKHTTNISTAIPVFEGDASRIVGRKTENGTEVDAEMLPSVLMQFAEYYLAFKLLQDDPDLKIVVLDRTLAGDLGHLIWSVSDLVREERCLLKGLATESGVVSSFDLELGGILHTNSKLGIPTPRSQFIKYCAIDFLLRHDSNAIDYQTLLDKIGANSSMVDKFVNDITVLNRKYSFLKSEEGFLAIKPELNLYWERILSATLQVAKHIFETPDNEHPLIYEVSNGNKKWITSEDLEYMTLVIIYALIRHAWERNILLIGLIKDTNASELIRTVVPLLVNADKISISSQLPNFNSDKQLLQTYSVIQGGEITSPWRTFEFDACLRTITPIISDQHQLNHAKVSAAYKNMISGERMFLKSYVQLWNSKNDDSVRGHVFSYDRLCYDDWDMSDDLILDYYDGNVKEVIRPMIHFAKDSDITHLVMDILCSMANEVIPECLGHNYPLFLADKKAKYVLDQMKTAYLSAVAYEMANSEFDQQILYQAKFRDFRSQVENSRRSKK
jgi:hypothetical protein